MIARRYLFVLLAPGIALGSTAWVAARAARQNPPDIRVSVEMVQLDVAVTDNRGKYITGLKPSDFSVAEDGIGQSMAMFAEGDNAPRRLSEVAMSRGAAKDRTSACIPPAATPAVAATIAAALRKYRSRMQVPTIRLSQARASTFSLIRAITCITVLFSRRTLSPISCSRCKVRIAWRSIRIAGTFFARRAHVRTACSVARRSRNRRRRQRGALRRDPAHVARRRNAHRPQSDRGLFKRPG